MREASNSTVCRPRELLLELGREFPNAWAQAEQIRSDRSGLPAWPDWCYLPMAGWDAIARDELQVSHVSVVLSGKLAQLAALGAWRMTQGVYRFDPALYAEVVSTPVVGDIPHEILYQLPEWCVYVETPDMEAYGQRLYGAFAHLEHDANTARPELRLLLDLDSGLFPLPLHLGAWPLEESIARSTAQSATNMPFLASTTGDTEGQWQSIAAPLVSLLVYLCTQFDFRRNGQPDRPANPTPKKTRRHGMKLFPADGPSMWDVGVVMGTALRAAYHGVQVGTGTHGSPRGHMRRAHWHAFLVGPKKDAEGVEIPSTRRRRDVRWIPPIPVNLLNVDELPTTIRPVKKP